MTLAISAFVVSVDQLKQTLGSRNQPLVDAIRGKQDWFLSSVDEIDGDNGFTCAQAVSDLMDGRVDEDCPGYFYGYGFMAICRQLGTELAAIESIARAHEWIEEIDSALSRKGVPLMLSDLLYAGSPVPVPASDDYPSIGAWDAERMATALGAIETLELSDLEAEAKDIIVIVKGWLREAGKYPNRSIVGFLS